MLETLAKVFFRVRESKILFRESFAKVEYYNNPKGSNVCKYYQHSAMSAIFAYIRIYRPM